MLNRGGALWIALGCAVLVGCGGNGGGAGGGDSTADATAATSSSTGAGGASSQSTSATSSSGMGGQGGGAQCAMPGDCPGSDTACHARTCVVGACGVEDSPADTPCNENGGKVCDGSGTCVACNATAQCSPPDVCTNHMCAPPPCQNMQKDPGETDVDCGGVCVMGNAGQCALGMTCAAASDCVSGNCVDGRCCNTACSGACQACDLQGSAGTCSPVANGTDPANECSGADVCNGTGACRCTDGAKDGGETDVDCGGGTCPVCADGKVCAAGSDCSSGVCTASVCAAPSCGDGVRNGTETDVDCGGGCAGCPDGGGCVVSSDCNSGVCTGNVCQPAVCGDGTKGGSEQCDDGNTASFDGCSYNCLNEADHLLISEVKAAPTTDEFIEIYNPTGAVIDLSNYYLADNNTYYLVTQGGGAPIASDFRVHFPAGSAIGPHAFVVVSLESATSFQTTFGFYPDFDLAPADANAPDMVGQFGASSGLTDAAEMVVLFYWDGASALVKDVDYMNYGNTSTGVDKTGIMVGAGTYAADTPLASQVASGSTSYSLHRCDTAESSEAIKVGGNGITGHDETSENASTAFKATKMSAPPSPKAPPPAGFCQ